MLKKLLFVLYLLHSAVACIAQPGNAYTLGLGLLNFGGKTLPLSWNDTIPVYKDSALTVLWTRLDITQTNCPSCLACAEPEIYYGGPFFTFSCGAGKGPSFIYTRSGKQFHEIITDTSGTRAYIPAVYGTCATWEQYILIEAGQGEYFRINRQWDTTILFNRPYPGSALPASDSSHLSPLSFANTDDLKFYPVTVKGNWLQLKAMSGRKRVGYCWIIWRNEKQLFKWFAWSAD